ncbi:MAG: ceramidase domain-containing protein [Hyphomicrobiaceae bacterium]
MDWRDKVFIYCERGLDPAFWAEPLNALSNGAFIIAALLAFRHLTTRRDIDHGADVWVMATLVLIIGIGSFLFHTFAERWAELADVLPITVFILAFLVLALRTLAGAPWWLTGVLVIGFLGLSQWIGGIRCGGGSCLNGSVAYLPAFLALGTFAPLTSLKRHPAAKWLWAGLVVFAVSLTFRTIDMPYCPQLSMGSRAIGTHFLWHILNGTLLYLLLRALMARPARR